MLKTAENAYSVTILLITLACTALQAKDTAVFTPRMKYSDSTYGRDFAKDPDVVKFKGSYFMYYTVKQPSGYAAGVAQSKDMINWKKVAEIMPVGDYEKNGLAAPCAIVLQNRVHLFYQTYGNGPRDAICHAVSDDGINFIRNKSNPVFSPTGSWNCGRAIDADAVVFQNKLLLYWATRDPAMKIQMVGVSSASLDSDFGRSSWKQICDKPVLSPTLPWEKKCIEAPAVVEHKGKLYMFYAGAYNNQPQQIGCAVSCDGINYTRLSDLPLLPNGTRGQWNHSESGHPGIFTDSDNANYLFFQGNNDNGKTWYLSKMRVKWEKSGPYLVRPADNYEFHLVTGK